MVVTGFWQDTDLPLGLSHQAKEFGVPEVWMNERLMRIAPRSFAEFLYAFEEDNGKQPDLLWLVWRYEGDYTLFDLLQVFLPTCPCCNHLYMAVLAVAALQRDLSELR
jgi:hypothetical protein